MRGENRDVTGELALRTCQECGQQADRRAAVCRWCNAWNPDSPTTHQDSVLVGAANDSGAPLIASPDCGEALTPDPRIRGAFECLNENCFDESSIPIAPHIPGECPWCQSSLSGGESYAPCEDGSNENAYVICPSCQQKILQ